MRIRLRSENKMFAKCVILLHVISTWQLDVDVKQQLQGLTLDFPEHPLVLRAATASSKQMVVWVNTVRISL